MIECSKCGLANLDHVSVCVDCGTSLVQEGKVPELKVYPPRAGRFKKLCLLFYKINRNIGSLDTSKPVHLPVNIDIEKTPGKSFREYLLDFADFKGAAASIIPGLGHVIQKRYLRALIVVIFYLLFIALGVLFYGRVLSNLFFGCAISLHAIAIFDCLPLAKPFFNNIGSRVSIMVSIIILTIVVYYYINDQISEQIFGSWINVTQGEPVISQGDFILIRKQEKYQRGDIVFCFGEGMQNSRGYEYTYLQAGLFFDRIIGLPGEKVEVMDHKIFVNGEFLTEEFLPLQHKSFRPMTVILGENQYFVYDSTNPGLHRFSKDMFRLHNIVTEDNIRGRAFMIYAPYSRMRFLD